MSPAPREKLSNLPLPPAQIEPYVRVLGVNGAIEFLLTFGGAELYLSPNPRPTSRLVQLVGDTNARALAEAAEFLPARVPLSKPWIAVVWYTQGITVADIARRLHTSDVSVRRWMKTYRARYDAQSDPRQLRLL